MLHCFDCLVKLQSANTNFTAKNISKNAKIGTKMKH